MFDELTFVADRVKGRQYLAGRDCAAGLCADRCLLRFKIYYDCQHTRCCTNGLFGVRLSGMSRHPFNADHGTIHVSGDSITGRDEVRHRHWKEEQDDGDRRDCPKDHFVKGHYTGPNARAICHIKRPTK
jgi:hypothetical protein